MNLNFSPKFWPAISLFLAVIFLLLSVIFGLSQGTSQARAQATFENAKQVKQALDYFYGDNNRYPTDAEFTDQSAMGSYFSVWPLPQFSTSLCPQTFVYKQLAPESYQLNFCLEAAAGGYQKGWNSYVQS